MGDYYQQLNALPKTVRQNLTSIFGSEKQAEIAEKYDLTIAQMRLTTDIVMDIVFGKNKVSDLPMLIAEKIKLKGGKANEFATALTVIRFLPIDDYLKGAAKKFLQKQGKDLKQYDELLTELDTQVKKEIEQENKEAQTEKIKPKKPIVDPDDPMAPRPLEFADPEQDKEEMKAIFEKHLLKVFDTNMIEMKIDFNVLLTKLLLEDNSFQLDLLNSMASNQELITKNKIVHNNEKVEPTIANWLKDFISHLDLKKNETLSTLQKAKYYNESPNIKNLSKEERQLVDNLFDLYENISNFYVTSEKLPMSEIQLFTFTEEEQQEFIKKYQDQIKSAEPQDQEKEENIYDQYLGNKQEREKLMQAEKQIVEKTRKESDKLANEFYQALIKRNKFGTIAALKLAVETGILDDLIVGEERFIGFVEGYLKRNNLEAELNDFKKNPRDLKFVKYFIKYILSERLGLQENEAARIALQLGNIYRQQGVESLAQIAYYDMKTKSFKWI